MFIARMKLVVNSSLGLIWPRFRDIRATSVDPWCWDLQIERTSRLSDGEIIFEEFQPVWSRYLNLTDDLL